MLRLIVLSVLVATASASVVQADDANQRVASALAAVELPGMIRGSIGVTRHGTLIPSLITAEDLDVQSSKTRVLLVGGLDGSDASVRSVLGGLAWFAGSAEAEPYRRRFALSAAPIANPDGWAGGTGPGNEAGGDPTRGYPPQGTAYNSHTDPEAQYLWRWIGMHAPDLVVDVRAEPAPGRDDDLIGQLPKAAPSGIGPIPAERIVAEGKAWIAAALARWQERELGLSPARRELQRRARRSPLEVAPVLSRHYGHTLEPVQYIQAVALIGRLRLGELTGDPSHLADVERIAGPYLRGERPTTGERVDGSILAGHLVFGELARITGKPGYTRLVRHAADFGFDEDGEPREAMPFHHEMSDAVFMGCPILVQAGSLAGEGKYFQQAQRHLEFMLALDRRDDGLYRHSPLDRAAWGRGNGFPALGLTLCLELLPPEAAERRAMLAALQAHLRALAPHQDETGMWRQVIDHPGGYRELTSTSMITYAMARGVRGGWLPAERYDPLIDRAWGALCLRIADDGTLVDVCTGTGKQPNLRAYLDRTAILGEDARGGAMALLAATEVAAWMTKDE